MQIEFNIDAGSITALCANLRRKNQDVRVAANTAVANAVAQIFARAQQNVPVVTGALAASGRVTSTNTDQLIQHVISYGSSNSNPISGLPTSSYAVDRHESYNPKKPESYKWLENAVLNNSDVLMQELTRILTSSLRS